MAGRCLSPLLSLLLVALAVGAAHGAGRRKAKETVTMEDYLEGHKVDVEPPPKNASPLDLCILPYNDYPANEGYVLCMVENRS